MTRSELKYKLNKKGWNEDFKETMLDALVETGVIEEDEK